MTAGLPPDLSPMLATPGPVPAEETAWSAEAKWDGVRVLVWVEAGGVVAKTRNGTT